MTYNIRFDNLGDGLNAWPLRKDWVAKIIRDEKPDVVGLQEALRNQIDDLAKRLDGFGWYGLGRDDGKQGGEHAPLFYRQERFDLLDKGSLWLSETPDKPGSKGWDAALPRVATWLKLKDKSTAREWLVCNVHFDHVGRKAKLNSAQFLLAKLPQLAGSARVVLLGDFNVTPDSSVHRALTNQPAEAAAFRLHDAKKVTKTAHVGPDTTWNAFQEPAPGQQIDFIFVGPKIEVRGHRILEAREGNRFASDHYPVVADALARD